MNTYYLKLIYPGMNSSRYTIKADGYLITEGGYEFFTLEDSALDHPVKKRIVRQVYPVRLTIIENIEYTDES